MFIATIRFPAVPEGEVQQFLDWFTWSNEILRATPGLRQRRLLRGTDNTFSAIVEHDSAETFSQMHHTEEASRIQAQLATILDERPQSTTFEVAAELVTNSSHCCGAGDEASTATPDVRPSDTTATATGCCA